MMRKAASIATTQPSAGRTAMTAKMSGNRQGNTRKSEGNGQQHCPRNPDFLVIAEDVGHHTDLAGEH